ncbi:hypothetical protein HK405_008960, partial [Cladochytrium tenue]
IVIGLRGNAEFNYRPDGKPDLVRLRTQIVSLDDSLFDGSTGASLPTGVVTLPFSFSLKPGVIPPSFSSAAMNGPAAMTYSIKAVVTYKSGVVMKSKEAEAAVIVLPAEGLRARMLAMQSPLEISNTASQTVEVGEGGDVAGAAAASGGDSSGIQYLLNLRRRTFLVGETVAAYLTLAPSPRHRVEFVSLSLRSRFVLKNGSSGAIELPAYVLALAKVPDDISADNIWAENPSGAQSALRDAPLLNLNGSSAVSKIIEFVVPESAPPSIETALFSYSYMIRLTIKAVDVTAPLVVVEVPAVVVARGTLAERTGIPVLPRNDSLGREVAAYTAAAAAASAGGDLTSAWPVNLRCTAVHPYSPRRDNELELTVGNSVIVHDSFEDGWACGTNLTTGKSGFLPMHHVHEQPEASPAGPSRSPSPSRSSALSTPEPPSPGPARSPSPRIIMPPPLSQVPLVAPPSSPRLTIGAMEKALPAVPVRQGAVTIANQLSPPPRSSGGNRSKSTSPRPQEKPVEPVSIDDVANAANSEAHLGLLHRFCALLIDFELTDSRYLCRAERRYILWLEYLRDQNPDPDAIPLPPIDVALMWHAHMVNPLRYYEDCFHIFGTAKSRYYMPLERMHAVPGIGYEPEDGSQEKWAAFSKGEPFTLCRDDARAFEVICPWCNTVITADAEAYSTFRLKAGELACKSCECNLTFEKISAKRLIDDCGEFIDNGKLLRGSVLSPKTNEIDPAAALTYLNALFKADQAKVFVDSALQLVTTPTTCDWRAVELRLLLLSKRGPLHLQYGRILTKYRGIPAPFSLDLIAAVRRQRPFSKKMVSGVVDWLERDAVPRATVRYSKFLTLMKLEHGKFIVPTLDIDLVWHTHQLFPQKYQQYGLANLGYVVHHDDGVEQGVLDDSFATTSKLWKRHFNEKYGYHNPTSKWFRRSPASLYPPYATAAAASLGVAVNRGAKAGGCVTHDPTRRVAPVARAARQLAPARPAAAGRRRASGAANTASRYAPHVRNVYFPALAVAVGDDSSMFGFGEFSC